MKDRLVPIGNALLALATVFLAGRPGIAKEKTPQFVLLIRHAEKPAEEKMSVDLSPAGRKRAAALPGLFEKSPSRPLPFATPDFIFAAKDSKHSRRCTETVAPLARKLGLKVNTKFANDDFAGLAAEIRTNPKYAGKKILICWHHGNLPGLARKLGAAGAPDRWKGVVFDRVWRLVHTSPRKAVFAELPQHLLPGDEVK